MNRYRSRDVWLGVALAAVAGLALLALVVALLPAVLAPRHAFATAAEAVAAQNDVRATLLQALGGAILVMGAWSAWRQVQLGREGLITERFSRAVDQLGHDKREVRVGGIYALARIARNSPEDRRAVVDVLAAYLRTHAPWPPALPDQPPADTSVAELAPLRVRAPDVLAAMVVLGQIPRQGGWVQVPPLPSLDLRNALLGDARLEGPSRGHLVFEGADLSGAHLERAGLRDARMAHAYLRGVHLEEAVLYGADLSWTVLSGAHLQGADLRGANLYGAKLEGACLDRVRTDATTIWPDQDHTLPAGRNSPGAVAAETDP
jgi:Pentapeptide repeats (8 copies)